MKKLASLRAKALNASLIAFVTSTVFCLILFLREKKLTNSEYTFPFHYGKGVYEFTTIPSISIWWIVLVIPLLVFGIRHMLLVYREFKDKFLEYIPIVFFSATVFGILGGALACSLDGNTFWSTILGILISTVFIFFDKDWNNIALGPIFATVWATVGVFTFCLFRTSLGFAEVLAITIGCGILFFIFNTIIDSLLYVCIAIVERIIIICKTAKWLGHTEAVIKSEM